MKELQDAMIVMAHLEKRQSEMLRDHAEWRHAHDKEIAEFRRRTRSEPRRDYRQTQPIVGMKH